MSCIGGDEKDLTAKYNGRPWVEPWDEKRGTSVGKLEKVKEGLQLLTSTNINYLTGVNFQVSMVTPTVSKMLTWGEAG